MHRSFAVSTVLAAVNVLSVLSLANAQDASQSPETAIITSTAPGTTVVVTATATGSPASRTSADPETPDDTDSGAEERVVAACFPGYFDSKIDWTAPCPAVQIIYAECTWGPEITQKAQEMFSQRANASDEEYGTIPDDWEQQPVELQRACFCSSQYTDVVLGCGACLADHGVELDDMANYMATSNVTAVKEFAEIYCDADVVPTDDDASSAFGVLLGQEENYATVSRTASSTASDTLGTATAVSLYFTPSASSGYTVDMPTASSSADQTHPNAWYTYTSLRTSDGLIVPTAVAEKADGGDGQESSQSGNAASTTGESTTSAEAGAMQTAMAYPGFGAGALGFAALAFVL